LLLALYNKIEWMIAERTVFLTGIAGNTVMQDGRIFPGHKFFMLLFCLIQIEIHILAFHDAVTRRALLTDPRIELQLMHIPPFF
jgi:hypothetical protein